jgi:hypothetical protein
MSTDSSPSQPTDPTSKPDEKAKKENEKTKKEIPLVSVPNDRDLIAEEMEELFDEDRVTHQHGSSEPEAD